MRKTNQMTAWLMLMITSLAFMLTMFQRQTGGGIQQFLSENFGFSATEFSIFTSIFFYPYMFMQIVIGVLVDKHGVRKCVSAGLFLSAAGAFLMAFNHEFLLLCIARLLVGIGVSYGVIGINKTATAWFPPEQISSAVSIANIPGSIGSALAQGGIAWLIAVFSWKFSNIIISIISLILAIICCIFYRETPTNEKELKEVPDTSDEGSAVAALVSLFRNRHTYPVLVMGICFNGAFMLFANWVIAYLQESFGLSNVNAASLTSIPSVVSIFALLIIPPFAEHIHSRRFSCVFAFVCGTVTWGALAFGTNLISNHWSVLYIIFAAYGIHGISMAIIFCAMREVNDPRYVGTSVGVCNFISTIGCIVVPMAAGVMIDQFTEQGMTLGLACQKMFILPVALMVIGTIAAFLVPETRCQSIYVDKKA